MTKSKVEMIQEELKRAVGPIGSFIVEKQIKEDIKGLKTITPTSISMKYDIRVSTAKKLLQKYCDEGLIVLRMTTPKMKVYSPA